MSFDESRFHELRREQELTLGEPLIALATVTSTNDLALEAARNGAAHGATFVADEQTSGRGRQGRRWFAPSGESLLCSCVTRPALRAADAGALPLAVGLAVREVVSRHVPATATPMLKWPNDVLVSHKKICGVLVESQVRGSELAAAVIGVGLNLRTTDFPDGLAGAATSIAALGGNVPAREEILVELLRELARYLALVEERGLAALAPELERYDALIELRVDVDGVTGRARGLDPGGRLLVVDDQGVEHRFVSGHVRLLDG